MARVKSFFLLKMRTVVIIKYMTYVKHVKVSRRNIQMKKKVILQASDSSKFNKENEFEQDRSYTNINSTATCRNDLTPPTQHISMHKHTFF